MFVYSVMGGYNHEGFDGESLQLFDCKPDAEAYSEKIKSEWNYDYIQVKILEVQNKAAYDNTMEKIAELLFGN